LSFFKDYWYKEAASCRYVKRGGGREGITMKNEEKMLVHEIMDIGIPSFLETLSTTFVSIIDSKMISSMGVAAISAVAVTNQPKLFVFSVFFAINTVTSSLIAKYYGKEDKDAANRVFDHVLKLTIILSVLASILCVALARPIMIAFSNQKDVLEHSILYYRIIMGGMIFNMLFMVINSALRGCGKTKLTLTSNVISGVVNIFFNYLLIEGRFGFPRLEYAGAAIATVLGTVAASAFSIGYALKEKMFVNIVYCLRQKYKMTKESLEEIVTLAKSTVMDSLATRLSLLIIAGIVARIGSYQMAVYSTGMHLLNVNMALGMGLQTAGVALIGRNYGASDFDRMHACKRELIRIGTITALALAAVIILSGKWFFGFFSSDPQFIAMGTISCIFIGVITLSQTLKFVYSGCLLAVSAMKEVMMASIISFAGVNLITLAILVLVFKVGLWGVWIATLLSQTTQAILLYRYIRRSEAYERGTK
jgi:putative MATE family efflux protein